MDRRVLVEKAILDCGVLEHLAEYSPCVVSTIHVGLDIVESDIDIICAYRQQLPFLERVLSTASLGAHVHHWRSETAAVIRFWYAKFWFEVYGSTVPVPQQAAYRHFEVMKRLVDIGGKPFQQTIRNLKQSGLKTEPAIAKHLRLSGNPYDAVLKLESLNDDELCQKLVMAQSI